MHKLTATELFELSDKFGIELREAEIPAILEIVNSKLEAYDDLPASSAETRIDERTWKSPETDPYNAIAVRCSVPPIDGQRGPLSGMRVGVKDNICVGGIPLRCASRVFDGFLPESDATVIRRIRSAGGTITAKTNLDEFAGDGRGTTGRSGPIVNPHDSTRTAGGSSGGSAVAVASDVVDVALGTDTGGSIRMPSSFCGVVGVKPTYGLVPLTGVVENTYTMDHVGPITASVRDAALVLDAIAGKDTHDAASNAAAGNDSYRIGGYTDSVDQPPEIDTLRLGVLQDGFEDVAEHVEQVTRSAIETTADRGASVERVTIPSFDSMGKISHTICLSELAAHWRARGAAYRRNSAIDASYQAEVAAHQAAFGGELGELYKAKLLTGASLIDAHHGRRYTRAQSVREQIRTEFESAVADYDVLVMPTMLDVAPPIDDVDDPGFNLARNTRGANLARLPAITIPVGTAKELPVGLQLLAGPFREETLLAVASVIESLVA